MVGFILNPTTLTYWFALEIKWPAFQLVKMTNWYLLATRYWSFYRGRGDNWNQVLKMGTWSEPVGLGQNDPDHFSAIKDCLYSAFWAFRYVRAYRGWCVHSAGRWTSRYSRKSTDKICPLIFSHLPRTSVVQDQVVILTTWLHGLDQSRCTSEKVIQ